MGHLLASNKIELVIFSFLFNIEIKLAISLARRKKKPKIDKGIFERDGFRI